MLPVAASFFALAAGGGGGSGSAPPGGCSLLPTLAPLILPDAASAAVASARPKGCVRALPGRTAWPPPPPPPPPAAAAAGTPLTACPPCNPPLLPAAAAALGVVGGEWLWSPGHAAPAPAPAAWHGPCPRDGLACAAAAEPRPGAHGFCLKVPFLPEPAAAAGTAGTVGFCGFLEVPASATGCGAAACLACDGPPHAEDVGASLDLYRDLPGDCCLLDSCCLPGLTFLPFPGLLPCPVRKSVPAAAAVLLPWTDV